MDRATLMQKLREELRIWSTKSYTDLLAELGSSVVAYECGATYRDGQVEVILLEKTPEYVHVSLGIDDGGWRSFCPLTTSFLVYQDGRIDCPEI